MTHEKTGQGCEAPRPALDCVAVAADTPENKTGPITSQARPSWRDVLLVHQAADLFKLMTDDELMALGKDIEENGLKVPVVFIEVDDSPLKMTTRVARKTVETSIALLDGRNRLDALEARGWVFESVSRPAPGLPAEMRWRHENGDENFRVELIEANDRSNDPYDCVLSLNAHRRHLTPEQKRERIAEALRAKPDQSNRQVAEQVKVSPTTVGVVRRGLESTDQIGQLKKTTGKDGKARTTKPKKSKKIDISAEVEAQRPRIEEAPAKRAEKTCPEPLSYTAKLLGVDERAVKAVAQAPKQAEIEEAIRNAPTAAAVPPNAGVSTTITIESIKGEFIRFSDEELEDLRLAIETEQASRRRIAAAAAKETYPELPSCLDRRSSKSSEVAP